MLLTSCETYKCDSVEAAESMIQEAREAQVGQGFELLKASYVKKQKKAKGEVIDEAFIVTLNKKYNEIFE